MKTGSKATPNVGNSQPLPKGGQASDPAAPGKGLLGSDYARSKKALMATVNEIRATGAAVDVDLPTIVVAGNQSSGKSSLIEAISGINLPRAVGTCTRVPIEVRLKQEDVEWFCEVKVRREGSDQKEADDRKPEVNFGPRIIDPSLVEATIRRAQLGILNPSVDLNLFVKYALPAIEEDAPLGSKKQFGFSTDVIVLEITGPNETDLTLVDLPGIIQNVGEGEDKKNITLIENMVNSYIRKDCLILLVITMKDDIQNQKAALLAREADPEGKRTIGVLTKVDTVTGRTETDQWLRVVQNQREKLSLGYFVTRQPDADSLAEGISFAAAREQEDAFFRNQQPWKGLDRQFKKRLGTRSLAEFLSDKLSSFIQDRLPELEKQIANRHKEINAELSKLGKGPSDDPTSALLSLLTTFEASIGKYIVGQPDHESFIQKINKLNKVFEKEIAGTQPLFAATERSKDGEVSSAAEDEERLAQLLEEPEARMYLDDMRFHIECCRTRELPNQLPPSALAKLIQRSTLTWKGVAFDLLESVKPVIEKLLFDFIRQSFGKYEHGRLPAAVTTIVQDHLDILYKDTQTLIDDLIAIERRPRTQNDHYLNSTRDHVLAYLKEHRPAIAEQSLVSAQQQVHINSALAQLAAAGMTGVKQEDLSKLGPVDEYETEMDLMAQTKAYWTVAFKRVIDSIPGMIDLKFLAPISTIVRDVLIKELQVFGDNAQARCGSYLGESSSVADLRNDLTVRRDRLVNARQAVKKFNMK